MLGFWPGRIRTPWQRIAPIDLQWEKHKKNLLLRNHKAQSFHILCVVLCVAMYSGPFYKSCLPCPAPGVSWEKHKKSSSPKPLAMFSGPLYKSCQSCPWGPKWPRPGGH